jgi:hypothetical protein
MKKYEFDITEIKICNYVHCRVSNDAGIYKIIAIDGWSHKVMLDGARQGTWYTLDKIKPIPLTEKWLKEFGIEAGEGVGKYTNVTARIIVSKNFERNGLQSDDRIEIKYVHQYQNIHTIIPEK